VNDDEPVLDAGNGLPPERARRLARLETTGGPYFTLIIEGLKESEAAEIRDILVARGYL
jgi:hypothetical protein